VGATLGAGAATDAVVLHDLDLAARQADDAAHAAEQTRGIGAVPAGGWEHVVFDLQPAQLQAARAVPALARVDAVAAIRAEVLVDDQDLAALGDAFLDQHARFEGRARRAERARGGEAIVARWAREARAAAGLHRTPRRHAGSSGEAARGHVEREVHRSDA